MAKGFAGDTPGAIPVPTNVAPPAHKAAAPAPTNTYYNFAVDVLKGLGEPVTPANIDFIMSWARREGGGGNWNPLNTTLPYGNSTDLPGNSAHVKNYASFSDGVNATVKTLQSGLYKDIRNAFSTGHADKSASYGGLSTWSGGGYQTLNGIDGAAWAHETVSSGGAGGGGGSTGAGAPVAPPKAPALSPDALSAGLTNDGFAIGLIDSTPELKGVFTQALKHNWSVQETMLHIQNTHWYRTHTQAQQQYLELQHQSPDQLNRKIQQTADDLTQLSTQLGVPLGNVQQLAQSVVYNGLDPVEQTAALVKGFHYKGQALTGQVGSDVDSLKQLASQYFVKMSNGQIQDMAQRMLTGQLNPNDVADYFKQQAVSKFPHLQQQINSGMTVQDIADPYKHEMGQILYDDPSYAQNISNDDPLVLKALQQTTDKGTQLMPIWQFQQTLRQDPRWLATNNARDTLMDSATGLLKKMGLTV